MLVFFWREWEKIGLWLCHRESQPGDLHWNGSEPAGSQNICTLLQQMGLSQPTGPTEVSAYRWEPAGSKTSKGLLEGAFVGWICLLISSRNKTITMQNSVHVFGLLSQSFSLPIPIYRAASPCQDTVIGCSRHVGSSPCRVLATRVGSGSAVAQIVQLVEKAAASASTAPAQRFADAAATVFVPCVVLLAALTALVWFCGPEQLSCCIVF